MGHIIAKVQKAEKETEQVSLLTLDISINAQPGQFVMAWLPGTEEKPMSVANASPLQLAIADAGEASKKMASLKKGDILMVRGPYGKAFSPKGKKWLMVGGGYGFAPLRFLAKEGIKKGAQIQSIIGARSKKYLMKEAPGKNHFTTDDGSAGEKGNVMAVLEPLLKKEKFDCIYCCGPEKMMLAVALLAKKNKISCQLSVERYMKCGFGVCGHCAMGGWLSCIDGPTIDGEEALKNPQFGKLACDRAGKHVKI
ncbi:dihydroorotate dehydrogenase electron transfer subunit [Candidatus Micrarchaeota archaeon CG10_big_fil_rev_8_21_14_0_10_45_29]|nr:MAG: dihydroorotate dehydrogenase electron transfer subunit [Candidatus Micrarchaeota archaeon CG10_big_fil_rev_8_21_14_0_10_45_29]